MPWIRKRAKTIIDGSFRPCRQGSFLLSMLISIHTFYLTIVAFKRAYIIIVSVCFSVVILPGISATKSVTNITHSKRMRIVMVNINRCRVYWLLSHFLSPYDNKHIWQEMTCVLTDAKSISSHEGIQVCIGCNISDHFTLRQKIRFSLLDRMSFGNIKTDPVISDGVFWFLLGLK